MPLLDRQEHALYTRFSLKGHHVQTLTFADESLIDFANGQLVYRFDGSLQGPAFTSYGASFDGAVSAPDGRHVIVYQRLGTKALLIQDGKLCRELNRSYYHAEAFEYPIGFVRLPDGRTGIAHCPDHYCQLEIEDALTGERLTRGERKPADFFHSRLSAAPKGATFLSAGWIWQPWDAVAFYDVAAAIENPRTLDPISALRNAQQNGGLEETAATWLDDQRVVIASGDDSEDEDEAKAAPEKLRLRPRGLAVFDVQSGACQSSIVLDEIAGTIMAAGPQQVVAFFRHPRLISLRTGAVLHRFEDLYSGERASSIYWHLKTPQPQLAFDPAHGRFAVAGDDVITVVQLNLAAIAATEQA